MAKNTSSFFKNWVSDKRRSDEPNTCLKPRLSVLFILCYYLNICREKNKQVENNKIELCFDTLENYPKEKEQE